MHSQLIHDSWTTTSTASQPPTVINTKGLLPPTAAIAVTKTDSPSFSRLPASSYNTPKSHESNLSKLLHEENDELTAVPEVKPLPQRRRTIKFAGERPELPVLPTPQRKRTIKFAGEREELPAATQQQKSATRSAEARKELPVPGYPSQPGRRTLAFKGEGCQCPIPAALEQNETVSKDLDQWEKDELTSKLGGPAIEVPHHSQRIACPSWRHAWGKTAEYQGAPRGMMNKEANMSCEQCHMKILCQLKRAAAPV